MHFVRQNDTPSIAFEVTVFAAQTIKEIYPWSAARRQELIRSQIVEDAGAGVQPAGRKRYGFIDIENRLMTERGGST